MLTYQAAFVCREFLVPALPTLPYLGTIMRMTKEHKQSVDISTGQQSAYCIAWDNSNMTSRIFLIRHGEAEWFLNQQHTGSTEVPLTSNGEQQVKSTAKIYFGDNKMVHSKNLSHM